MKRGALAALGLTLVAIAVGVILLDLGPHRDATAGRPDADELLAGEPAPGLVTAEAGGRNVPDTPGARADRPRARHDAADARPALAEDEIGFFGTVSPGGVRFPGLRVQLHVVDIPVDHDGEPFVWDDLSTWLERDWIHTLPSQKVDADGDFTWSGELPEPQPDCTRRYVLAFAIEADEPAWPRRGALRQTPLLPLGLAWGRDAARGVWHGPVAATARPPMRLRVVAALPPDMASLTGKLEASIRPQRRAHDGSWKNFSVLWVVNDLSFSGKLPYTARFSPCTGPLRVTGRLGMRELSLLPSAGRFPFAEAPPQAIRDGAELKLGVDQRSLVVLRIDEPLHESVRTDADGTRRPASAPKLRVTGVMSSGLYGEPVVARRSGWGSDLAYQATLADTGVLDQVPLGGPRTRADAVTLQPRTLSLDDHGAWGVLGWLQPGVWDFELSTADRARVWRAPGVRVAPGSVCRVAARRDAGQVRTRLELPHGLDGWECAQILAFDGRGAARSVDRNLVQPVSAALPESMVVPLGTRTVALVVYDPEAEPRRFRVLQAALPDSSPAPAQVRLAALSSWCLVDGLPEGGCLLILTRDPEAPPHDPSAPERFLFDTPDARLEVTGLPRGEYAVMLHGHDAPHDAESERRRITVR